MNNSDPYQETGAILRQKSEKLLVVAQRMQEETGWDFTQCWNRARRENPELIFQLVRTGTPVFRTGTLF